MSKYELLPEHEAQMKPWSKKWIDVAFNCKPYSQEDLSSINEHMTGLYEAANLPVPTCHVIVPDPVIGAFASGFAAGIWWLRDNKDKHIECFGRMISEQEILEAAQIACNVVDQKKKFVVSLLNIATSNATWNATQNATEDATWNATWNATQNATENIIVNFLFKCASFSYRMYNGGNNYSGYACWISFFREVVKLDIDYSKWIHYEIMATFGPRWMHSKFWIVSERPISIKIDNNNLSHNENGPSHKWSSGLELYYWHGVKIPKEWITNKENLDPSIALTWENIEQRRCASEIIGWNRVLELLNPKIIQEDPDPQTGTLLEVELEGVKKRFLKVRCGTGRTFALPVPPAMQTAAEANAWTYGIDLKTFGKLEVRT